MSCKVQQSVCSDCVTYAKSRIKFNAFNTFNNVENTTITKLPVFGAASATHKSITFWSDKTGSGKESGEAKSVDLKPKKK